jgi:single-strand DNA-binding protein
MSSFNKVILMGNLTRDPEMVMPESANPICKLGLAVNRRYSTRDGEQREEVTFLDVDAFGRQAETISRYMSKGRPILIEGRLKMDEWEDKNTGQKRSKLKVVCENFQFVGGREEGGGGGGGYENSSPPRRTSTGNGNSGGSSSSDVDDDVPF